MLRFLGTGTNYLPLYAAPSAQGRIGSLFFELLFGAVRWLIRERHLQPDSYQVNWGF